MTTVYSNSTAIPHGTGDPNTDLDDSKRSFDVYEAYQRALADEEVSLVPCPSIVDVDGKRVLIQASRYPPLLQQYFLSRNLSHVLMVKSGTTTAPSRNLTLFGIAGTMFELVQALNDGAESLKKRVPNLIGLTAGCELFIGFVTLFPHESAVSQYVGPIKLSLLASCDHLRNEEFFRAQEGDRPAGEELHVSCSQLPLQDS